MANRDRFGHVIPEMEKEIMAHFDTAIRGDFGNTAEILEEASKDLAADNAASAAEDYGRCTSNHHACTGRDAALKAQIERLILRGAALSAYVDSLNLASIRWDDKVLDARELIK